MIPKLTGVLSFQRWLRTVVLAICAFLVTPSMVGAVTYGVGAHVYDGEVQSAQASVRSASTGSAGDTAEERAQARAFSALMEGSRPSMSFVGPGSLADDILPKPVVSNTKLRNIVDDLYKGTTNPNRVGTGTTADAVRNELTTGLPTAGTFHSEKAKIYTNDLSNVLKTDISATDRLVANSLLDDLVDALGSVP